MKGFKHSGNGPRYVQNFAVGGLATGKAPESPGFSDFKKGGKVMTKKAMKEQERRKALSKAGKLLRKARGGGVSDPMPVKQALSHAKGGLHQAFEKLPGAVGEAVRQKMSARSSGPTRRYTPIKRATTAFNYGPAIKGKFD